MPQAPDEPLSPYQELFLNLPGFVYRAEILPERDNDGGFLYMATMPSPGCHALLGLTQEEVVGRQNNSIEMLIHPDDLAYVRSEAQKGIENRIPWETKHRLVLSNGEIKWIWEHNKTVYAEDGTPLAVDCMMLDISGQKNQEAALEEENRRLRDGAQITNNLGKLAGRTSIMQRVYGQIRMAAAREANMLVFGETGTGKDMAAQLIHELSGRKGAFVPVNCGAISEHLLESEFFGHYKGSFSGAHANKDGYLAAADGGTLFLDELGELPLHLQVKLLRAIESKTYTPVGGHTPKASSFRLIAATNRDLAALVRKGDMRADFYHRVHVLSLTMPPLRERKDDIPLLVDAWGASKGLSPKITPHIRAVMVRYDWPGNIRELYNFLERYYAFGDSAVETLDNAPGHEEDANDVRQDAAQAERGMPFASELTAGQAPEPGVTRNSLTIALDDLDLKGVLTQVEKLLIEDALARCRWRQQKAADKLGLSLKTLQRRMAALNIAR